MKHRPRVQRNFREGQALARRNSRILVVLFCLGVMGVIAAVYPIVVVAVALIAPGESFSLLSHLWSPGAFALVSWSTFLIVGLASWSKIAELRGGGHVLAKRVGARLISTSTTNSDERRLRNVVEEMAIACGTHVPPVFVQERQRGINAFAAGYTPNDAVICVTAGSLRHLSRDELQGMVAHEFSHILNGDMRLNIRLTGLVHGLLVIGLVGEGIAEFDSLDRRGSAWGFFIGGSLMIVGYAGTFFGEMIKAAVSRQREYLADATAVDFTRNPGGIAGALKKIGGLASGARVRHPHRREVSHMFFAQSFARNWNGEFNTHPPLLERVRRVEPSFDGKFRKIRDDPPESVVRSVAAAAGPLFPGTDFGRALASANRAAREGFGVSVGAMAAAVALVGRPLEPHVDYAKGLLASMPEALKEAARDPYGARALVYALLLDSDAKIREAQFQRLGEAADATVLAFVHKFEEALDALDTLYRLPLLDLLMPALHELSREQRETFLKNVTAL
ncbi:MAG: M48 family metallopeptidase, partial [Planctomycetota bacterium]